MKTSKQTRRSFFLLAAFLCAAFFNTQAQTTGKTVRELSEEIDNYVSDKSRELAGQGKRVDADKRADLANERKSLAGKYAAEASTRTDLSKTDYYFLGLLYSAAEENQKGLDTMKKFLAQYPPDIKGDMIQSARSYVVIFATRRKQMAEAEQFYLAWTKGDPFVKNQQPMLGSVVAVGFFKDGQFEQAIKYGQEAFDLVKTFEAKNPRDKATRNRFI